MHRVMKVSSGGRDYHVKESAHIENKSTNHRRILPAGEPVLSTDVCWWWCDDTHQSARTHHYDDNSIFFLLCQQYLSNKSIEFNENESKHNE